MSAPIFLSEPVLNGHEWKYVKDCLDTGWVSSAGQYIGKFEEAVCRYTGVKYAVALSSGTAALHMALKCVGVEEGDEVIVPTVTFIAPINAVRYLGAHPVFMDCDPFYNMDMEKVGTFLKDETVYKNGMTFNKRTKRRIRAVVPVHVFGNAVDLSSLLALCQKRNIRIVEDAAESLGSYYTGGKLRERYTGTVGDIGCYSFNGNKIITAGGGGMLITNNPSVAREAQYLTHQAKDDALRYIHNNIGYNFRLNNIQAAMGLAQLKSLTKNISIKNRNYEAYKKLIDSLKGLHLAEVPPYARNNYWMYALRVNAKEYGIGRDDLMSLFHASQIMVRPLWYLNHLQKPYRDCQSYKIETANAFLDETINIPCGVGLKRDELLKVVHVLESRIAI